MLTSLALTSRQISSFGVVWISGHLLPVYRIAFWASYFDIFNECESVAVEAVRGEGIATIRKIAITQLDVAVVVSIHVRCDGDYGSLLINLLGFEWHRTSCGIEPSVVVMVGRDSTTSLGAAVEGEGESKRARRGRYGRRVRRYYVVKDCRLIHSG